MRSFGFGVLKLNWTLGFVGSVVPVAVVVNDEGDGVLVAAIDEHDFVGLGDSVVSWVFCPNLDVEGCDTSPTYR